MKYKLIVPPIYETHATGLIMAAEKTIGKAQWRIEMHAAQHVPLVFKNGEIVMVADVNGIAAKFLITFLNCFLSLKHQPT